MSLAIFSHVRQIGFDNSLGASGHAEQASSETLKQHLQHVQYAQPHTHIQNKKPPESEPARPSESGRTQIWDGRPNPAELRFGTAVRIRPNSDLGRPSESGRTQIGDDLPNPAENIFFDCK